MMRPASFDRESNDVVSRGLYLDLPPWGYHVFETTAVRSEFRSGGIRTASPNGRLNAASFGRLNRQLCQVGLVPRQYSTGGRSTLLGISKRGDKNIRHLLVQCARAFMLQLDKQSGRVADWRRAMLARRHSCVVACALASKLARIAWAIVSHNTVFEQR